MSRTPPLSVKESRALAERHDLAFIDPNDEWVDPQLIRRFSRRFAEHRLVLPMHRQQDGAVVVAVADPGDPGLLREVEATVGARVKPVVADAEAMRRAIFRAFDLAPAAEELLRGVTDDQRRVLRRRDSLELDPNAIRSGLQRGGQKPYIQLFNFLLVNGIERRASDIHIEPQPDGLRVRFRIDGMLREALTLPKWAQGPLIGRIKVVAEMDVADSRRPQDGKANATLGSRSVDLRVATMPGQWGEKVVIRLLDPSMVRTDLNQLGWDSKSLRTYYHMASQPQGLLLVVGPTGSGKSTTLYATIHRLNTENTAIVTIEDPVEYTIPGITQVQVNPKAGVTFATTVRGLLRQDPNVLVIGEVRDEETAGVVVNAANTGHLVLSTLHTVSATSAITRLLDLDVQPFLLAATLNGIVSQRLVRRVCPHCSIRADPQAEDWERLSVPPLDLGDQVRRAGPGCPACQFSGYRGRLGVFELVSVTEPMRKLLQRAGNEQELWAQARADGMVTLLEDALRKVSEGVTTIDEIARTVTRSPWLPEGDLLDRFTPAAPPHTVEASPSPEPVDLPASPAEVQDSPLVEDGPRRAEAPRADPADQGLAASPRVPEAGLQEDDTAEEGPAQIPEILIVDDAEEILMMVEMALEDDYRVRMARDGVEALEQVQARQPSLIVLDVMMPRKSGYEVCEELKSDAATQDIPVIMLSARGEAAHVKQGFYAGADDYLPKPFDPELLLLRIRALLRRSGRRS